MADSAPPTCPAATPLASLRAGATAAAYIEHDRLMDCIHCGLCLSQCPTYAEDGLEADSPRGRIYIMRAWAEGRAEPSPTMVEHLDSCLGCRACETACPSGVQYGRLLEGAREYLNDHYERPPARRWLDRAIAAVFPYPDRLSAALLPVRVMQRSGVLSLLRKSGLLRRLGTLSDLENLLPKLPPLNRRLHFPTRWRARGREEAKVGLLTGCVMPVMLPQVNEATARVLCKAGCSVAAPSQQGCCGALHAHAGDMSQAKKFARKNIEVFETWERENGALDAIIINAAGCGAALKEYSHWLHDDPQWTERASHFSDKVRDVSEFVAAESFQSRLAALMSQAPGKAPTTASAEPRATPSGDAPREALPNTAGAATVGAATVADEAGRDNRLAAVDDATSLDAEAAVAGPRPTPARGVDESGPDDVVKRKQRQPGKRTFTYHDACHLAHGQGVRAEPRALLELMRSHATDMEIVTLAESEMCCGSAGTYNITQPQMALRLLERKMKHIAQSGAQVVVTGNPGCAMQISYGARKFGVPIEVRHPVEVLDAATDGNRGNVHESS